MYIVYVTYCNRRIFVVWLLQSCNCLAFSPKPAPSGSSQIVPAENDQPLQRVAAGYSDGTVRLFDLGKVEMVLKMQPHGVAVTAICFSTDGEYLLLIYIIIIIIIIIIITKSYSAHVSTKQGTQSAEYIHIFRKIGILQWWILRPNYVVPYKVIRRIQHSQPGTPGRAPSLFDKCTGFFYMRYTTHGTNGFMSNQKDKAMVKCLA